MLSFMAAKQATRPLNHTHTMMYMCIKKDISILTAVKHCPPYYPLHPLDHQLWSLETQDTYLCSMIRIIKFKQWGP